MNSFNDSLISTVDRLIGSLGPINMLVDRLVDRLVPQATAQASCWQYSCYTCSGECYVGPCEGGWQTVSKHSVWGNPPYPGIGCGGGCYAGCNTPECTYSRPC